MRLCGIYTDAFKEEFMKKLIITLSSDENRLRFLKVMMFLLSIDLIFIVLASTTSIFK